MFVRIDDVRTMPLNAIGDSIAGGVGPLLLLWIVLGYLQQGAELKQNTRALLQQVKELEQLVGATSEQVEVERLRHKHELERGAIAALPRLAFERLHEAQAGSYFCELHNAGATASDIFIRTDDPSMIIRTPHFPALLANSHVQFQIFIEPSRESAKSIHIEYRDAVHKKRLAVFQMNLKDEDEDKRLIFFLAVDAIIEEGDRKAQA